MSRQGQRLELQNTNRESGPDRGGDTGRATGVGPAVGSVVPRSETVREFPDESEVGVADEVLLSATYNGLIRRVGG